MDKPMSGDALFRFEFCLGSRLSLQNGIPLIEWEKRHLVNIAFAS